MGKSYGQKKATRLLDVVNTTENDEVEVISTLTDVAQQLKSATSFSQFLIASKQVRDGATATILVGDTIFGYVFKETGNTVVVVKTENPDLRVGDFIHVSELGRLAEKGERYRPRLGKNPDIENVRMIVFSILLDAIIADGGHRTMLRKVDDFFEQERKRVEAEERKNRQKKEADECAGRILADINSGKLSSNPMLIFDTTKAQVLGFGADAKPKVFLTGYQKIGAKRQEVLCIVLDAAPLGSGGYEFPIGTYIPIAKLFDESHVNKSVAEMAKFLISLFDEGGLEDSKEMCRNLASAEGFLPKPAKALPMQLEDDEHVLDISVQDMFNYFRQGQIGDIAQTGTSVH
jgi:hypothetical protein